MFESTSVSGAAAVSPMPRPSRPRRGLVDAGSGVSAVSSDFATREQLTIDSNEVIVDSALPPLFGLEWSDGASSYVPSAADSRFRFNQVFDRATFDDLRQQLWNRAQADATAMVVQKDVTVLPNDRYGVAGGNTDLLWTDLHPVNACYRQLHDTVKLTMHLQPLDYSMFPNYYTIDQLHLNARQVNPLAHLTSRNVASEEEVSGFPANPEVVRGFLSARFKATGGLISVGG